MWQAGLLSPEIKFTDQFKAKDFYSKLKKQHDTVLTASEANKDYKFSVKNYLSQIEYVKRSLDVCDD